MSVQTAVQFSQLPLSWVEIWQLLKKSELAVCTVVLLAMVLYMNTVQYSTVGTVTVVPT